MDNCRGSLRTYLYLVYHHRLFSSFTISFSVFGYKYLHMKNTWYFFNSLNTSRGLFLISKHWEKIEHFFKDFWGVSKWQEDLLTNVWTDFSNSSVFCEKIESWPNLCILFLRFRALLYDIVFLCFLIYELLMTLRSYYGKFLRPCSV